MPKGLTRLLHFRKKRSFKNVADRVKETGRAAVSFVYLFRNII
jgi:hypothetical protein